MDDRYAAYWPASYHQTFRFHCSVHLYHMSLNFRRSSNVQGCNKREHRNMHQTDTACAWLVCHSQEGLCKLYPAEARAPSFLGKPVMRPRSMVGRAPSPCGRHWVPSRTKTNTFSQPVYTHSLNPPHSINTRIPQSNSLNPPHPHSPQPTHRLTHLHLSNPICPLCKTRPHTTDHLFNCTPLYTSNNILDLWMFPGRVLPLLARWKGRLAGLA